VLVDVPPLASNPAVSAVRAADRVAVVAPPASRGTDAVQRIRGRLKDVGTRADVVVANRGDPDGLDADAAVPEGPSEVAAAPTTADGDGAFAAGVGDVAETLFECDLGVDFESGGLLERVR
jgi:MinD superfamily P-loop ATPase